MVTPSSFIFLPRKTTSFLFRMDATMVSYHFFFCSDSDSINNGIVAGIFNVLNTMLQESLIGEIFRSKKKDYESLRLLL